LNNDENTAKIFKKLTIFQSVHLYSNQVEYQQINDTDSNTCNFSSFETPAIPWVGSMVE
jgi:hypothetical protein